MVQTLKAVSDENRLRILGLLMKQELCVCELEVLLEMNQSNVSRHLRVLKSASIVSSTKKGPWVFYHITDEFKSREHLLYEHLQKSLLQDELTLVDLKRLNKYTELAITCQAVTEDKEEVSSMIQSTT